MEKAYWGRMHWGNFRWGVRDPVFDRIKDQVEAVPARSMGGMDPFVAGGFRAGYVRAGVYRPVFDAIIEQLEKK